MLRPAAAWDDPVFTDWQDRHADLWGRVPLRLSHRLHRHALFCRQALARLIESYPRDHYTLVQWGAQGEYGAWREGELGGLSGEAVLDAVARSTVWINLRRVQDVDPRYGRLLDAIFGELAGRLPGFAARSRTMGILVSSPGSRTIYHADLPGQSLWQIHGRKRVYVYPRSEPFIAETHLEQIALTGSEFHVPYRPWYDEHARVFDIAPGDMLHWPLNAPHRVDNFDCLNVSMTLEYFTEEIRRAHMVTVANGMLRARFGRAPGSRAISGPSFWAKAALQRALRSLPGSSRPKQPWRGAEFRLDPTRPGAIAELAP